MRDPRPSAEADGVLVASVWRATAGGTPLVRLTMTRPGVEGETVRVFSTSAEALAGIEEWLSSVGP